MSTEQNTAEFAVATFHCLSTPARRALFWALGSTGKRVTTLAHETGRHFNHVSNILRLFLDAGLVEFERDGPFHYYRLTPYGQRVRDVMRSREAQ